MAKKTRHHRAHDDGILRSLKKDIERQYGLPKGSVQLVKPTKRRMREDATVLALKNAWK